MTRNGIPMLQFMFENADGGDDCEVSGCVRAGHVRD